MTNIQWARAEAEPAGTASPHWASSAAPRPQPAQSQIRGRNDSQLTGLSVTPCRADGDAPRSRHHRPARQAPTAMTRPTAHGRSQPTYLSVAVELGVKAAAAAARLVLNA